MLRLSCYYGSHGSSPDFEEEPSSRSIRLITSRARAGEAAMKMTRKSTKARLYAVLVIAATATVPAGASFNGVPSGLEVRERTHRYELLYEHTACGCHASTGTPGTHRTRTVFRTYVCCLLMGPCCELLERWISMNTLCYSLRLQVVTPTVSWFVLACPCRCAGLQALCCLFFRVRGTSLFSLRTSTLLNVMLYIYLASCIVKEHVSRSGTHGRGRYCYTWYATSEILFYARLLETTAAVVF